jgi:hypothetical protein
MEETKSLRDKGFVDRYHRAGIITPWDFSSSIIEPLAAQMLAISLLQRLSRISVRHYFDLTSMSAINSYLFIKDINLGHSLSLFSLSISRWRFRNSLYLLSRSLYLSPSRSRSMLLLRSRFLLRTWGYVAADFSYSLKTQKRRTGVQTGNGCQGPTLSAGYQERAPVPVAGYAVLGDFLYQHHVS